MAWPTGSTCLANLTGDAFGHKVAPGVGQGLQGGAVGVRTVASRERAWRSWPYRARARASARSVLPRMPDEWMNARSRRASARQAGLARWWCRWFGCVRRPRCACRRCSRQRGRRHARGCLARWVVGGAPWGLLIVCGCPVMERPWQLIKRCKERGHAAMRTAGASPVARRPAWPCPGQGGHSAHGIRLTQDARGLAHHQHAIVGSAATKQPRGHTGQHWQPLGCFGASAHGGRSLSKLARAG